MPTVYKISFLSACFPLQGLKCLLLYPLSIFKVVFRLREIGGKEGEGFGGMNFSCFRGKFWKEGI